jgi:sugar phosphate isomerase/epimerase
MKFIIQSTKLQGDNMEEKFLMAKSLGLDGVELAGFRQESLKDSIKEISQASERTGIYPKVLCGGYKGWLGHFDDELRNKAIQDIMKSMEHCAEIGVTGLIAPAAVGMYSNCLPASPAVRSQIRSKEEDKAVLVEGLKQIREAAEKYEVVMLLEPLNRYEDHMVNTVSQAVSIIEEVDSPYVKVMADSEGVELNFQVMNETVAMFRERSAIPEDWNDEIKKDYKKRGQRK